MNPTKTETIKRFLEASTHPDLAALYNHNMECQVNVAQDGGTRVEGEFKGKAWHGFTDGIQTWKPIRIPYKANSDPEFSDSPMQYDLASHVEAIGMTGWDWWNRTSRWVAYDFDAISGHSDKHTKKLTESELEEVKNNLLTIDWVTLRRSTSGRGLHLYVFIQPVSTQNHTEHAALARAILGKLSALTGYDFSSKVDICGQNMWVWHRKMRGTHGLELIRKGEVLTDIPPNWKDHVKVVTGHRKRNVPNFVTNDSENWFLELTGQTTRIPLDNEHKRLIKFLEEKKAQSWWDADNHMLVTHTWYLKEAHKELEFRGIFETISAGKEAPNDINCFAFPLRKGGWAVRRYSLGVQEHPSWDQDGRGWTRCYFNREPDLASACRSLDGVEDPKGGFVFKESDTAKDAATRIGAVVPEIPTQLRAKKSRLKTHKDGRLIMTIEGDPDDHIGDQMKGWHYDKGQWSKVFSVQAGTPTESEIGNYDDMIRHLVTENGDDFGWTIKSEGNLWRNEPLGHVQRALEAMNMKMQEVKAIIGSSVMKPWILVNRPFQPEYPGDRKWNREAAQFRFAKKQDVENLSYPTWQKILQHIGHGLDEAISTDPWAKANNILSGADYLKIWIASLFQEPEQPLPYLFLHGPQNSGKSILHEAISLLVTKGYVRADASLLNPQAFNGELENAILCVVEETDLGRKNQQANNRIKDWVTARDLMIHPKGKTPYHIRNTTHWIQCANDPQSCPVFPGDTRITMVFVEDIDPIERIVKKKMIQLLEQEAPDFLTEILNLEVPTSNDRLNIPVITTASKMESERSNETLLQTFLREKCFPVAGRYILLGEFYQRFAETYPEEIGYWTKVRVGRSIPPQYPKGRLPLNGQFAIGNLAWEPCEPKNPLKAVGEGNNVMLREAANGNNHQGSAGPSL